MPWHRRRTQRSAKATGTNARGQPPSPTLRRAKEVSRPRNYVQPRSRKIISKIGIGIPRSQSKMYPVAPACLNLSLKCILISFFLKIARERTAGLQKVEGLSRLHGLRRAKEVKGQGLNPMRGLGGGGGRAGGSMTSITRCKIVTITAS
jgi:hypothetical protein